MVNVPKFLMGDYFRQDYDSGVGTMTNALAAYRDQGNKNRAFEQGQQQFQATNALARAQLGIQQQAAARAEAEAQRQAESRAKLQQFLGGAQFEGVPEPLVGISRATGDAGPLTDFYKAQAAAQAKARVAQNMPEGYGKAGAVFEDPATGEFKAIQFGERGNLKTHSLTGMRPSKGVKQVGDELVSGATGETVRRVGPQLANEEIAKGEGRNVAKVRADLADNRQRVNLAVGALTRLKQTTESLEAQPGLGNVVGGLYQALAPDVSTGSLNARTELENLKVKISGTVLQAMRDASKTGGAVGQVTEREWPRLENMIANLDPRQGKEQFLRNLRDVRKYAEEVQKSIQQAYEADVAVAEGGGRPVQPTSGPQQQGQGASGWSIRRID